MEGFRQERWWRVREKIVIVLVLVLNQPVTFNDI